MGIKKVSCFLLFMTLSLSASAEDSTFIRKNQSPQKKVKNSPPKNKKIESKEQSNEAETSRQMLCQKQKEHLDNLYFSENHHQGFLLLSLRSALLEIASFLKNPPANLQVNTDLSPQQFYENYYNQTHPYREIGGLAPSETQPESSHQRMTQGILNDLGEPQYRVEPLRVMSQILESSRNLRTEIATATQGQTLSEVEHTTLRQNTHRTLHALLISSFLRANYNSDPSIARSFGIVFAEDPFISQVQSIVSARPTLRAEDADYFVDPSKKKHSSKESIAGFRIFPRYRTHLAIGRGKAWLTLCTIHHTTACATVDLLTGNEINLQFPNGEFRHPLAVILGKGRRTTSENHFNIDLLEASLRAECQGTKAIRDRDSWAKRMLSPSDQDFMENFIQKNPIYADSNFQEKRLPSPTQAPESEQNPQSTTELEKSL